MNIPDKLQNVGTLMSEKYKENPTIVIKNDDPEWENAFNNWKQGKPPTDSPEWKKGVYLIFKHILDNKSLAPDNEP